MQGLGSRRTVRTWIASGRVAVQGRTVTRFAHPVGFGDQVWLDGEPVTSKAPRTVLLMNKPRRHLTAIEDGPDLPGLGRYLPEDVPPVFPVGRLDVNTEGALLWTNDGPLARRILHPDHEVPKRYGIKIRGHLDAIDDGLERMRGGMTVGRESYRPAQVSIVAYRSRATWVEVVIREGKHRQLRRMCRACGYQIVKLRRLAIGPVELGDLNPRCVRPLTPKEVAALERIAFGEGTDADGVQ